ncbi:MAG TPA: GTP-dependent dephospho-CoA kinase family protein [Candidatus Binatus sp.]|nr:GTP-dependent dephospho-CoA kinase family protein [Candidatus Binatus sp.]
MGQLIKGNPEETMPKLKEIIEHSNVPRVVTVGDVVSSEARLAGIRLNLGIIDGKTMRRHYSGSVLGSGTTYHVSNPSGTITDEAWSTIRRALKDENAMIIVDGEEDLLTLPATIEAPINALIVYGQPSVGIVVVRATREKKAELKELLDKFEKENLHKL